MNTVVLACETIRDELEFAVKLTGSDYEIIWVESGLHNNPDKLRTYIQSRLDSISDRSRVLMAFGSCGNSVVGLKTGNFELIIPRVDDCISLLIGSVKTRMDIGNKGGTYFLTPGWLRGERNLWAEYCYAVEKYGERKADRIMKSMLEHYSYLGLLDTKCYNIAEIMPEIEKIAEKLKLTQVIIPASVDYLCDLLTACRPLGSWDEERFLVIPPNSTINDFQLLL